MTSLHLTNHHAHNPLTPPPMIIDTLRVMQHTNPLHPTNITQNTLLWLLHQNQEAFMAKKNVSYNYSKLI